jgi:hypothetical protein
MSINAIASTPSIFSVRIYIAEGNLEQSYQCVATRRGGNRCNEVDSFWLQEYLQQ